MLRPQSIVDIRASDSDRRERITNMGVIRVRLVATGQTAAVDKDQGFEPFLGWYPQVKPLCSVVTVADVSLDPLREGHLARECNQKDRYDIRHGRLFSPATLRT